MPEHILSRRLRAGGKTPRKKASVNTPCKRAQHARTSFLSCAPKRAQLQTGETIMVLFILMFMGAIALVFVGKMGMNKYQITLEQYEDLDSIETAQLVTSLYEVRCTKQGFEENCIDIHKALAFANMTTKDDIAHLYYYGLLKNSKVLLREIYPGNENITLFEHNASIRQSGELIRIPISLYNSSDDTHAFATLEITRYHTIR